MVLGGWTYQGREEPISGAHVLAVAGGALGTLREAEGAARNGARLLLLNTKTYPAKSVANTYMDNEELSKAKDEERLVVCESIAKIPECIEQLLDGYEPDRAAHMKVMTDFMGKVGIRAEH